MPAGILLRRQEYDRINRVVSVNMVPQEAGKEICLTASGFTSIGYSEPQLWPYLYLDRPLDSIWDFDYMVKPPTGHSPSTQTLESSRPYILKSDGVFGVRVHAVQNTIVQMYLPSLPGNTLLRLGQSPSGQHEVHERSLPQPYRIFDLNIVVGDDSFRQERLNLVVDGSDVIQEAFYG
jgi:hypothetical protein